MTIVELVRLVENKLAALNSARATAAVFGNVNQIIEIDLEILTTQDTLLKLKSVEGNG